MVNDEGGRKVVDAILNSLEVRGDTVESIARKMNITASAVTYVLARFCVDYQRKYGLCRLISP